MLESVVINQLDDIFVVYIADNTIRGILFFLLCHILFHLFGKVFMKFKISYVCS